MKISIIIPTFNEEKYLPKLLKSIQKQSFKDFEVIISDANSTDKTPSIAEKFNFKLIKGGLPAKGRNNGAKHAKGKYLLFLDSDTIISKKFLEKLLFNFEKEKANIASVGINPIKTPRNKKKYDFYSILFDFINFYLKTMSKVRPFSGGYCIFIKKKLHNEINGFDEKLRIGEDFDYVLRAYQGLKPEQNNIPFKFKKILDNRELNKKNHFIFFDKIKINLSTRRIDKETIPTTIGKSIVSTFFSLFNKEELFSKIMKYEFGKLDEKEDKNKLYSKITNKINKTLEKI